MLKRKPFLLPFEKLELLAILKRNIILLLLDPQLPNHQQCPQNSKTHHAKHLKNAFLDNNQTASNESLVTLLSVDNVSAKRARLLLAERSFCPLLAEFHLREQDLTNIS